MSQKNTKVIKLFFIVIALTGFGLGLSDSVFANYYKDAYQVDGFLRGVIELPRELPGILCMIIISSLSFLGDIRLSIVAQALSMIGLVVVGLFTPSFGVMLFFLFINSLGMHMFMPLADSIGLSLAEEGKIGSIMGKFNGIRTAFLMIAGMVAFWGFKTGFFSFVTPVKSIFLIAAGAFAIVLVLLVLISRAGEKTSHFPKFGIAFHKEYRMFYTLAILYGARKQIMYVYAPWVLIELLGFEADTMAILAMIGAGIGIFFIPAVGRLIDKYGTPRVMMIEAAFFVFIYIVYGVLSAGLSDGWIATAGISIVIAFIVNILDRMTIQFGMVRSVYMRSIALRPEDVTPTLSAGLTLDHILSVIGAVVCGYLWKQWGPQYVFVLAALLSVANMIVAQRIKREPIQP